MQKSASQSTRQLASSPHISSQLPNNLEEDCQYMVVTSAKRRDRQFMAFPSTYSDLRIVEYCLVLAKGIMRELNSIEILSRQCYFGRYGPIQKIIISSKHNTFTPTSQDVQAFVTYRNKLDAAWAITALQDTKLHNKHLLRAHFGTSRYCNKFINGQQCNIQGCYFNHYLRQHQHKDAVKGDTPAQYLYACQLIRQNLSYFVEKQYKEFKNGYFSQGQVNCKCLGKNEKVKFPSSKETMVRLIAKKMIDEQTYLQVKKAVKLSHRPMSQSLIEIPQKKSNLTQKKIINIAKKSENTSTIESKKKRKVSETLEEYIQNNIISEVQNHHLSNDLECLTTQTCTKQKNLKNRDILKSNLHYCQEDNIQIGEYLIEKIMKYAMGTSYRKRSRFQFVCIADWKAQLLEEKKFKQIIGTTLMAI